MKRTMLISELQKLIVGGLNLCGLSDGDITLAMLFLKTEDQRWEAAE